MSSGYQLPKQPFEQVMLDIDRDRFMTPEEAVEYGLVDKIVDRQAMIDQTLSGYGSLGNDLYAPFDPAYASDLPQREQDIEQARSLLKAAGQEGLQVELFTGDDISSVDVRTLDGRLVLKADVT